MPDKRTISTPEQKKYCLCDICGREIYGAMYT